MSEPATRPTPAAQRLILAYRSVGWMFVGVGALLTLKTVVTFIDGPDWYGRGPNLVIADDAVRSARFFTFFSLVLAAGVGLIAEGVLLLFRQLWAVFLGFPVTLAGMLAAVAALFVGNSHILVILFPVFGIFLLGGGLVSVLMARRSARIEAEFTALRDETGGGPVDEVGRLAQLLEHPKRPIRVKAVRQLGDMGKAAAPAVPALTRLLSRYIPPTEKGLCSVCCQKLNILTQDKMRTEYHPDGFPVCLSCRDRMVQGGLSEPHYLVAALSSIGAAAEPALSVMDLVRRSFDPSLAEATQVAIEAIVRAVDRQPANPPAIPKPVAKALPQPPPTVAPLPLPPLPAESPPDQQFIRFQCHLCQKDVKAPPQAAGKRVKCPHRTCGTELTVPPR